MLYLFVFLKLPIVAMVDTNIRRVLGRVFGVQPSEVEPLADEVGVSQAYIAKLESGDKKNPTLDLLKKIAKALGVPVTELLE